MSIFRRKSRRAGRRGTRRGISRAASPSRRNGWHAEPPNSIAEINLFGPTAVATLTVTSLSTERGVAGLSGLLREVSHTGAKSFVLDIQNLEYMDSLCLGCLIRALNHASANGGRIALVHCEGRMLDIFRATRLDRKFPLCHDVMSALAAVEKG